MPTYEVRLSDLVAAYRSIFGIDAELSESVPDYQLLSVSGVAFVLSVLTSLATGLPEAE
jgi:hypothetical protein